MIYQGKAVKCQMLDGGIAELIFDKEGEAINKLNLATIDELKQAVEAVKKEKGVKGLLITSTKDTFIVGADVNEFLGYMKERCEILSFRQFMDKYPQGLH